MLYKKLSRLGDGEALMMPVPRKLSASCGTCVKFSFDFSESWPDEDMDSVYLKQNDDYKLIFRNEE